MHSTRKQESTCEQIILTPIGPRQNKFEAKTKSYVLITWQIITYINQIMNSSPLPWELVKFLLQN